jgi:hypothetical membrane protein
LSATFEIIEGRTWDGLRNQSRTHNVFLEKGEIMREHLSSLPSNPAEKRVTRWLALAGVLGPILFVALFTLAGFLRPGYSVLRQSISALGVGPTAWLGNTDAVIFAVLLLAFAIGFYFEMRHILNQAGRVAWLVLFILACVGIFNAAIFPAASSTAGLHWTIGFLPAFLAPVVAYLVVGWQWRRVSGWQGYGWYSLVTALLAVVLIVLSFALLAPRRATGGPATPIGGLIERVLVLVAFAWPVVVGWRLFLQGSGNWRRTASDGR